MSNHHFGEIGDVWKHLPLAEILDIEKPLAYWETHCGSASYAMDGAWERQYGIGRFLAGAAADPVLAKARYFELASRLMQGGRYPGSPWLALKVRGQNVSDYTFADTDLESIRSVEDTAAELRLSHRTRFFPTDGIDTAWRFASNAKWIQPADTLVHIDPFRPFEKSKSGLSAIDLAGELAALGYKVVYWYGFELAGNDPNDSPGWAWRVLSGRPQAAAGSMWCGEVVLRAALDAPMQANPGVRGCGVVCANLTPQSYEACARLGRALVPLYEDATLPTGESGALLFNEYSL